MCCGPASPPARTRPTSAGPAREGAGHAKNLRRDGRRWAGQTIWHGGVVDLDWDPNGASPARHAGTWKRWASTMTWMWARSSALYRYARFMLFCSHAPSYRTFGCVDARSVRSMMSNVHADRRKTATPMLKRYWHQSALTSRDRSPISATRCQGPAVPFSEVVGPPSQKVLRRHTSECTCQTQAICCP